MSKNSWVIRKLRARVDLLAGVAEVGLGRLGRQVDLREARGADREVVVGADQLDQLARVAQAAVGRHPLLRVHAGGRVAAQREHVLDPGVAHAVQRRAQLVDGRADAGEVRHRLQAVVGLDARDDVDRLAALGGRAAGAVGDRDEVGSSRASSASAVLRFASPSSVLGGKNSNEKAGSAPLAIRSSMRIARAVYERRPVLGRIRRACARSRRAPRRCTQPGAGQRHQPAAHLLGEALAVDRAGDLERRQRAVRQRGPDRLHALGDQLAVALDVAARCP